MTPIPADASASDRTLPPPPGAILGFSERASEAHAHNPEADTGAGYEADLLKRRGGVTWRGLGGNGFLVSVAVHALLLVAGLYWVVSEPAPAREAAPPSDFVPGGDGGRGDKAKVFPVRAKPLRVTPLKTPSRIVSKSANASVTALPVPVSNVASFASGLSVGGIAAGGGKGAGGTPGGGGRHFASVFGLRGMNAPGLSGTFYDCKLKADGTPSALDKDVPGYIALAASFVKNWDESLLKPYFSAPEKLAADRIFIPVVGADSAPKAYGVGDRCKASRWFAHYKGSVIAPKTGRFRFWGMGDDLMVVRWQRENYLDSGYELITAPETKGKGHGVGRGYTRPVLGSSVISMTGFHAGAKVPIRASRWFDVKKGGEYPVEVLIGETPGGKFNAWLMMEEYDAARKDGDGRIFLFRMSPDEPAANPPDDTGLNVDFSGKGLVWFAKPRRSLIR